MGKRAKYLLLAILLTATCIAWAGKRPEKAAAGSASNTAFDQVVDRVIAREAENNSVLRRYSPLVETYLQSMKVDPEVGMSPTGDQYYLHRVAFAKDLNQTSFHAEPGFLSKIMRKAARQFKAEFVSSGFIWMMTVDMRGLRREHYNFEYQGREFLGEVRCIVIDVTPKRQAGQGRFFGRVWVEDKDYNIVRFNGTFTSNRKSQYLHFDTWRLNMAPGVWLPAYIYSEDMEEAHSRSQLGNYRAVTRIWGYNVGKGRAGNEFTEVLVDEASAANVKDFSEKAQDLPPVAAERAWQRQAEDNVVERLERGGMLARKGEVDKVLNTVISNLEITNNLAVEPEVRCRVLLTSPIESFSFGHTIFLSRGMLDVLPDEASLAAVLAHELAHIVLGHYMDTTFAFKDRSIVSDKDLLARMHFTRSPREQAEADAKALEMLRNSPYKDKLETIGLFLRQVDARRNVLPHLIHSEMGNSMLNSKGGDLRLQELAKNAPKLEPKNVNQVAALPLGGRIRVDPWDNRIEINKSKPVALLSAREKMPLEISPIYPHLARIEGVSADTGSMPPTAQAQPPAAAEQAPGAETTNRDK